MTFCKNKGVYMKSKFIVFPLLCLLSTTLTGCIKDDIKALNEMDNHLQEQIINFIITQKV